MASFVADAKKQIAREGQFAQGRLCCVQRRGGSRRPQAQQQLLLNSAIAAVGILLLLIVVTGNWRNLLLILANVPFALVGGVLAVLARPAARRPGEGGLTIGSLVGFVTLFGITTRNSIMMISHFEHLVQRGRHDLGAGSRDARRVGAADSHPDDRARHRARPAAAGASAPAKPAAKSKARWPS